MSGEVRVTRYAYPAIATCEGPETWTYEGSDSSLRRQARKHAAKTGHKVRIDWTRSTVYERICSPPAPALRDAQGGGR